MRPAKQGKLAAGLLGINSASLDAPLVALAWLDVVSETLQVHCSLSERLLLFLVVWLTYAGDRLLDTRQLQWTASTLPRHQFVRRYQRFLTLLWLCTALATLAIAITFVPLHLLAIATGLAVLVAIYFTCCFHFPTRARSLVPRELVVAMVFTLAVFFFPMAESAGQLSADSHSDNPHSFGMFIMFCSLALANCVGISCWERLEDEQSGEVTLATRWPPLCRHYRLLIFSAVALSAILWVHGKILPQLMPGAFACLLTLGVLDGLPLNRHIKPVLADLSLLLVWLLA